MKLTWHENTGLTGKREIGCVIHGASIVLHHEEVTTVTGNVGNRTANCGV